MKVKLQRSYYQKMFEIIDNAYGGRLYALSAHIQASSAVCKKVEESTDVAWRITVLSYMKFHTHE